MQEQGNMKLTYICSPLRGDLEANVKRAVRYCEYAAGCGVIPIAPHVAWHGIFDDTIPEKRETALRLGLELLGRCDEIWVMGTEISQGMQSEIDEAERLGKPALYVLDETVEQNLLIRQQNTPLDAADAFPDEGQNYTGKIAVLNPDCLHMRYRVSDHSLWVITHGPGCRPGSFSGTVHATNLFDGDRAAFHRSDFYGPVKPEILLAWLLDHPIKSELIANYAPEMAHVLTEESHYPFNQLPAQQDIADSLLIRKIQDGLLPWENKLLEVLLDEACRQWCCFIGEAPERRGGEGFAYFFQQICREKQEEYESDIREDYAEKEDWRGVEP